MIINPLSFWHIFFSLHPRSSWWWTGRVRSSWDGKCEKFFVGITFNFCFFWARSLLIEPIIWYTTLIKITINLHLKIRIKILYCRWIQCEVEITYLFLVLFFYHRHQMQGIWMDKHHAVLYSGYRTKNNNCKFPCALTSTVHSGPTANSVGWIRVSDWLWFSFPYKMIGGDE